MTAARPDTAGIRAALPPDAPADVPAVAIEVFGDQVQLAERYVHLLATDGATRGLIGPGKSVASGSATSSTARL